MELLDIYHIAKEHTPDNMASTLILYWLIKRDMKKMFKDEKPKFMVSLQAFVTEQIKEFGKVFREEVKDLKEEVNKQFDKLVGVIKDLDVRVHHLEKQTPRESREDIS